MNRLARSLVPALLGAALLTGCGQDEPAAAPEASGPLSPLIPYVPADTPYVAANLRAVPDDVAAKLWTTVQPFLDALQEQLGTGIQTLSEEQPLDERDRLLLAVLRELDGHLSREGLDELGIGGAFYALYGDGALPVLRVDLTDRAALLAAIDRVEDAAGMDFARREQGDASYYEIRDPSGVVAYLGLLPDQLAVGLALPGEPSAQVAVRDRLLGASTPDASAGARLESVNERYGLLPYGTAWLEPTALLDALLKLVDRFAVDRDGQLTPACRADLRRLAGAVPEVASGYRRLTTDRIDQATVVAFADTLLAGLRSLATPMKGLAPVDEGAMYLAWGMDLTNLKAFAAERVAALQADPLDCEAFAPLMANLDQVAAQLAQPMPPFVGNFEGLRILVDAIEFDANGEPADARALIAVMMSNPQMMLGMGQAFLPQLAELELEPDGEPRPLPAGLLPPGAATGPIWVAMIQEGFGAALGEGMNARLARFLEAPAPPEGTAPLLVMSYDMRALADMQQGMLEQVLAGADEAPDPEDRAALEAELERAMGAYYDRFGRIGIEAAVGQHGLELHSTTALE